MYLSGEGVAKENALALKWFTKAAVQGEPNAQNNLALLYAKGTGVTADPVLAYAWFNVAVANGDKVNAVKNRGILEKMINPAQITEANKLSTNWRLGYSIKR
mgnify:CR=1 FL=1